LENFELARDGQPDEDDFSAAGSKFLRSRGDILETLFDRFHDLRHEDFFRNVARRRRGCEKWDPALLNSSLQFTPGSRALLDHAGATFPVDRLKIRRRRWRNNRIGPIWNRQALQKLLQREIRFFEKCDMLFQWHRQILADALRGRLHARSPNVFFRALHRRSARRRHEQARGETANNNAVKSMVVHKIGQRWVGATTWTRELHRAFAETFLQFIEIEIEPAARIADDHNGLGSHTLTCQRPEILAVIKRRTIT